MFSKFSVLRVSVVLNALLLSFLVLFSTKTRDIRESGYHRKNNLASPIQRKPQTIISNDSSSYELLVQNTDYCDNFGSQSYIGQRGDYWVLYNYIKAEVRFGCYESLTYSTHSDFTFLDNLENLLERWLGPVSIALYSPGTDLTESIRRIMYLRECSESLFVKTYVTFHLFFNSGHFPKTPIPPDPAFYFPVDCDSPPDFGDNIQTYRKSKNLTYPVNVARNVAREMSATYYVLASDIELYPSPNLISDFLAMIESNNSAILNSSKNPKVFVLPIFEVQKDIPRLPKDKTELQSMLKTGVAIPFHKFVCAYCHKIPRQDEWNVAKQESKLGVFHIGKREGSFLHWEPIYIGTKFEPNYDERLNWEGQKDKMTQGYVLCVLDYEFHILNNAFLVHRPGIKRPSKEIKNKNQQWVDKTNHMITKTILPELKIMYGDEKRCAV